jgi:peroxiredoxin
MFLKHLFKLSGYYYQLGFRKKLSSSTQPKSMPSTLVNHLGWPQRLFRFAAIYHMLLGLELIIDPVALFTIAQLTPPEYLWLMRGLGANVLVFALAFAIAMRNPYRYWVVGLMSFLLKLGVTVYLTVEVAMGRLPWGTIVLLVINDILWLYPLGKFLRATFEQYEAEHFQIDYAQRSLDEALLAQYQDQQQRNLLDLTSGQPALVVFLRHFGCTFCRETMAQLAQDRAQIEADGTQLVIVHQSEPTSADRFFAKYGLEDVARISDPERTLYGHFELKEGSWEQVFGWKSWLRGIPAFFRGHLIGKLQGNGYQMPGGFLVQNATVLRAYRSSSAADRVDYCELTQPMPESVV